MKSVFSARSLWRALLLLALGLAAGVLSGCQTLEPMNRPDEGVAMGRPADWARAPAATDEVLFELSHQNEPLKARLRRLSGPIIPAAHATWAILWLDASFDAVEITDQGPAKLSGAPATRIDARVRTEDGENGELLEQLWLANHAGETYLLEIWGTQSAIEKTAQDRQKIVDSVRLNAAPTGPKKSENAFRTQETPAWELTLVDPQLGALDAGWHIDLLGTDSWRFRLPARLISAEISAEALDYPISAATYAETALKAGVDAKDFEISTSADPQKASATGTLDADGLVPMRVEYHFSTRGERAVQLVVSTPAALYENNREVIAALVDSLRIKPRATPNETE